jgi:hypothetical protein
MFRAERTLAPGEPAQLGTEALDHQINLWVDRTGHQVQSISAPGLYRAWADQGQTRLHEVETVLVLYVSNPFLPPTER